MSCAITGQHSLLPVTALEFCNVSDSLYLLAGEGPHLKVFSTKGDLITQAELLPFCKIHGICPLPASHTFESAHVKGDCNLLVFGQKTLRFVTLQPTYKSGQLLRIKPISSPFDLVDWILDVCWLVSVRDDLYRVAAVTAHNVVYIIESIHDGFKMRVVAEYHCEINCILYSARLQSESKSELTVLSGTVFNEILLWQLTLQDSFTTSTTTPTTTTESISNKEVREKIRLTLSGHEGVIFSVRIDRGGSHVVSVSDDRTVRVWDLPQDWKSMERYKLNSCSLLLYGHTARVWDGQLLDNCVISIGEDATCRVWDYDGQCVRVVDGHKGRNIWSMAVDETTGLVATGGGDCSIRVFSLQTQKTVWSIDSTLPISKSLKDKNECSPRSVELCGKTILCLSNNGSVYAAEISTSTPDIIWQVIHSDEEYSGYAMMSLSSTNHWLALGSLQGSITLLYLEKNGMLARYSGKWAGHGGKVFSLTWLDGIYDYDSSLLSCGPEGEMVIWGIPVSDSATRAPAIIPLVCMTLPPSKHCWVTTAMLLDPQLISSLNITMYSTTEDISLSSHRIVCGDRRGSLHVYQINLHTKYAQLMQSLCGVHGTNGVTHIALRNKQMISCGRDGYCRTFSLHPHKGLVELTNFKPVKGMDWVEKQYQSDTNHLILGFHTTDMLLYNVTENRQLLSIHCGGGHRSYGFTALPELLKTKKAVVVYIKKSVISIRVIDLNAVLTASVLQKGFVGREAVSLQMIHSEPDTGHAVVAVGSEDTSICLLSLQSSSDGCSVALKNERFVHGHISSVRALSTSPSNHGRCHTLMFSGGARASLKVWRINVGGDSGIVEVTLEAELSIHDEPAVDGRVKIKRKKKLKGPGAESLLPECRIMALTSLPLTQVLNLDSGSHYVAVGCSDGIIRHYVYNESAKSFTSLGNLTFHNRCILSMNYIISPSISSLSGQTRELYLLSSATDGQVAVWKPYQPDKTSSRGIDANKKSEDSSKVLLAVCQAHQSGINDIAIQQVREGLYQIATVGDDNAIAVLRLTLTGTADSLQLLIICTECNAHASSITGASFLCPSILVTSSLDQRLNIWRISDQPTATVPGVSIDRVLEHGPTVILEQLSSYTHDVADASSLALYTERTTRAVAVICGIGIQYFIIDFSNKL